MTPTKEAIFALERAIAWLTKMKDEDTKKSERVRIALLEIEEALGYLGVWARKDK